MVKVDRKKEHWDYFSGRIQTLLADEVLCDVTLISEGKRFPANRMLLSGCSEYFQTMFTASFREKDSEEVQLKGVKSDILDSLIKFCNTGTLEINSDNAESLLRGAHYLQFPIVISICCEFILKMLSPANCLIFWMLSKHLSQQHFGEKIFLYCLNNFAHISELAIKILGHEELFEIVSNRDLNIPSEKEAFNVIMDWIGYEPETRSQHISQLAAGIDFHLVKQASFSKHIDLLRQFKNTQGFLYDMMSFYFSPTNTYNPLISTSRNSTFAPISLSAEGFQLYQERSAKWIPENGKNLDMIKNKKVLAAHVVSYNFYIVSEREGFNVTIEVYDLRNNSLVCTFANTPYKKAVAAFHFPMVYLVGQGKTFCGLDLLKMKIIKFPPASSVFGNYPSVVVSDEKLYVFGGEINYENLYNSHERSSWFEYNSHEITINNTTQCFLFKNQTWGRCAPMLYPVSNMSIAALNGKIYILGGTTGLNYNHFNYIQRTNFTNYFQCYDPIKDTWTQLRGLKETCYSMKVCVWNGKLLTTGNLLTADSDLSTETNVYSYDPESDAWKQMASVKQPTTYLFIASIDWFLDN